MSAEWIADPGDLTGRARKHAALADPTRLGIADLLTLGDVSPSELQERLGVPSNLLAHHLNVLERAGLVRRRRSEADRRRSYLQLVPGALAGLVPEAALPARRIVFVCTANSARSQLAAALWQQSSGVPVASAGTHPAEGVHRGAVAVARRHGLGLADARPRSLDGVLRTDDYLVTVCDGAHEELRHDAHARAAVVHWSVPDPVPAGSRAAFERAFEDLSRRVAALAPRVTAA